MRAARLARFGQLPIAPVAYSSASRPSRGVRQSSRPSTSAAERQRTIAAPRIISRNSRVPSNSLAVPREVPDTISSRASSIEISVFEKEEDEVEHLDHPPAPPSPPPPPPPPPPVVPPVGQHRIDNLICAQCRTPVARAPFRIFVLSETVSLVRNAEAAGMFNSTGSEIDGGGGGGGGGTSSKGSTKGQKEKKVEEMNESDLTWGGLFGEAGEETRAMKRARNAQLMRDDDDGGVHRCGVCNWEVDANGICEGWSVLFFFLLLFTLTVLFHWTGYLL